MPDADTPVIFLRGPGPFRRLAESALLFFCAILFFRAFAVEPFGVPTGSMASTLTGNHKDAACPRCGFHFAIGEPGPNTDAETHAHACRNAVCPNCGAAGPTVEPLVIAGDRLLVDKNVYHLRSPRRWEVAVFRCPVDPVKPYVKRVVGLPGESALVTQGDVHIDGQVARKSLDECLEVATLVFDPAFAPGEGWRSRWVVERSPSDSPGSPFDATEPDADGIFRGNELHLDGAAFRQTLTYRNWNLDRGREDVLTDGFAYNPPPRPNAPKVGITDFLVAFEVEVVRGGGTFWCQLTDGSDLVRFECGDGVSLIHDRANVVRSNAGLALRPGKRHRIIVSLVDRRASASVDGREAFAAWDLPQLPARAEVTRPFRLGVQGMSVVVRDLKLYRDLYYVARGPHATAAPHALGAGEYFVLGDNSPNSDDSRFWKVPGVPEKAFLGKPFLLHQPSRLANWNLFGNPRESQAIDWSRVRWLR